MHGKTVVINLHVSLSLRRKWVQFLLERINSKSMFISVVVRSLCLWSWFGFLFFIFPL